MDHVNVHFAAVSVHFAVQIPDLVLEGAASPHPGLASHADVWVGTRRSSIVSARLVRGAQHQKPLAELMAEAASARDREPSPEQVCEAPSRCRSLLGGEIDTAARPSSRAETHPSGTPRGQPKQPLPHVNVLSRPARLSLGRDAAGRSHVPPVHGALRFSSLSASPTARTPRLAARCPLPCGASALACATNEAG
jgi:hypothetical protein